jgi:hypothetical protein
VNELVGGIGFPMSGFAAAGDDDARTIRRLAALCVHSGGQVHEQCNRAEHAARMIDETNQLTNICFAAQINGSIELRVMVAILADLDELYLSSELIDYSLKAFCAPPLYGYVIFATCGNEPEWNLRTGKLRDLRVPGLFLRRKMDIPLEQRGSDCQVKPAVKEFDKTVQAMVGS